MVPTTVDLPPQQPITHHHHHISPLLIATAVLLTASFLLAVSYFIYSVIPQRQQHHPGLYITTPGLHPSVIKSIATCKYKTGDSPVPCHGTACAVCLAEFEDGESLRLLPTCCHAFHVLCIDTWLTSHTTCPICRAPVLPAAIGLQGKGSHTIEIIHGLGSS